MMRNARELLSAAYLFSSLACPGLVGAVDGDTNSFRTGIMCVSWGAVKSAIARQQATAPSSVSVLCTTNITLNITDTPPPLEMLLCWG